MEQSVHFRPPSISRRVSLRFPPGPPTELSTTLVLNGGGATNLFTDFRPFMDDPRACEWAFAGEKIYLEDDLCQWSHLVDSRTIDDHEATAAMPDIGRCQVLSNGDELEIGEMVNPASGKVEKYEEVWRAEYIPLGAQVEVLQSRRVVPNRSDPAVDVVHGIFVRIGNWAQGIARTKSGVVATRWHFDQAWRRVACYGSDLHLLPQPRDTTVSGTSFDGLFSQEMDNQWSWISVENYQWSSGK